MKTPKKSLLITTSWDDGHPSDVRVAELLAKHGLTGTFYVPCNNSEGWPVLSAGDIATIGKRFEIGGHTRDHVVLTGMSPGEASEQILYNKLWLQDILGCEVSGFAYVRGQHNKIVRSLVESAGFRFARTVKNLMSAPGELPYQVPVTAQFFPHVTSTYLRNFLRGGPTSDRAAILSAIVSKSDIISRLLNAVEACAEQSGCFHLWGHSWEIDEYNLWDSLDHFLRLLSDCDARFVTNTDALSQFEWRSAHSSETHVKAVEAKTM
ncbi:polysaccharide deacetylase family protein [Microvirga arabica]|uniref:Chitooligosaccharide deacetylase n=1 Tax=Microvirga arabica TaxID=1128671 RepID=A0ABV6YDG3_9HYPH